MSTEQLLNSIKNFNIDELMSILTNTTNNTISIYANSLEKSKQDLDLSKLTEYSEKLSYQQNDLLDNISITLSDERINLKDHFLNTIVFDGKKIIELNINFPLERQNCIPIDGEPESEIVLRELKRIAINIYFCHAIKVYFYYNQLFELHKNIIDLQLIEKKIVYSNAIAIVILNLKLDQKKLEGIVSNHISEMCKFNFFNYINEIEKIINCVENGEQYTLNYQITKKF